MYENIDFPRNITYFLRKYCIQRPLHSISSPRSSIFYPHLPTLFISSPYQLTPPHSHPPTISLSFSQSLSHSNSLSCRRAATGGVAHGGMQRRAAAPWPAGQQRCQGLGADIFSNFLLHSFPRVQSFFPRVFDQNCRVILISRRTFPQNSFLINFSRKMLFLEFFNHFPRVFQTISLEF